MERPAVTLPLIGTTGPGRSQLYRSSKLVRVADEFNVWQKMGRHIFSLHFPRFVDARNKEFEVQKLLLAILFVVAVAPAPILADQPPQYLVLRLPKKSPQSKASPNYYTGRKKVVTSRGYAYGWFGVPQRRHLYRHHGYYRHHTQWSAR